MDYPEIARALSLSAAIVEWRLIGAVCKMTRLLDLIDHARGRQMDEAGSSGEGCFTPLYPGPGDGREA